MTLLCDINAMPIGFVVLPLSHILLSFLIFPKSISLHCPVFEIPHVVLLIEGQKTMTVRLVIHKIAIICGLVGKYHITLAHFMVETEVTLIE